MNKLQLAYQFLKEFGITQKVIIRELSSQGITPPRTKSYSNQQLTRLVNDNYIPNPKVNDIIIKMAIRLGWSI
jgi:UDP-N-acetylmuramyl pentapeptide synthase